MREIQKAYKHKSKVNKRRKKKRKISRESAVCIAVDMDIYKELSKVLALIHFFFC